MAKEGVVRSDQKRGEKSSRLIENPFDYRRAGKLLEKGGWGRGGDGKRLSSRGTGGTGSPKQDAWTLSPTRGKTDSYRSKHRGGGPIGGGMVRGKKYK